MKGFAPRKTFSQNFLTDPGVADRIVASLEVGADDVVLEVGPGTGVLTQRLLRTPARSLVAVDLDPRAIEHVRTQPWAKDARLAIVNGDALRSTASEFFPDVTRAHRAIIGNIPYAITSDLIFWAFAQRSAVSRVVMMMQREVARRCVAGPGTKEYGILSVATWLNAEARILFHVQPGSFFPRPDVTSSVLRFVLREQPPVDVDVDGFMRFVRGAFSMRRKVMTNALNVWAIQSGVTLRSGDLVGGFDLGRTRAEELHPEQLVAVYTALMEGKGA
jgi:16S rRNA (adenine1518-N6/adenine1519-N6)-dimethyltransferase